MDTAQQDDETTSQKLVRSVMQFNRYFSQYSRAEMHQRFSGIKPSEIAILFMLHKFAQKGATPMKISDISKHMHVTMPTITQLLKGLETNGLIERKKDPDDKRSFGIQMTTKGTEAAQQAEKVFVMGFQRLTDYLGEEQSLQLAELMLKASIYFQKWDMCGHTVQHDGDHQA